MTHATHSATRSTRTTRTAATRRTSSTRARGELPYKGMVRLARKHGLTVTSTTGGRHNRGSLHGRGRAIDVRTRGVSNARLNAFMRDARAHGYQVLDERRRPSGQAVWSGPHLHLQKR
jgi:hypothetical protein